MDQDGPGSRRPLTVGVIEDETPPVLALFEVQLHRYGHVLRAYGEVITPSTVSISGEMPQPHRQVTDAVQWSVDDDEVRASLRDLAVDTAMLRARTSMDQYVRYFLFRDNAVHHPTPPEPDDTRVPASARSSMTVAEGYGVPGGNQTGAPLTGRTDVVAGRFGEHCLAATRFSRINATLLVKARASFPRQTDVLRRWGEVRLCPRCARHLWFGPCCLRIFCRHCAPASTHAPTCGRPRLAVRVEPVFRLANGQRPPRVFDCLPHPLWCMYRYIEGDRFTLADYYNAEDVHLYHQEGGIRFQSHLYRRDSAITWLWRIIFRFTIFHRSSSIVIAWEVHAAPHIDSWLLH